MNYMTCKYHDISMAYNHVPFWWPNALLIQRAVHPVGWITLVSLGCIIGGIGVAMNIPILYILSVLSGIAYFSFVLSLHFMKTISRQGGLSGEFAPGPYDLMNVEQFFHLSVDTQRELRPFAKEAIKRNRDAAEFGKIVNEYYQLECIDSPNSCNSLAEHHKAVIETRKAAKEEERRQLDEAMRIIQNINRKYEINGKSVN